MTTAKVGLHSLPTELKEQIVRYCRDQDALLKSALEDVEFRDRSGFLRAAPKRLDTARRIAARNRSLLALAAVSREWNNLVAPVLFEALPFNKMFSYDLRTSILFRRGHLFVRLTGISDRDFQYTDPRSHVGNLVHALPKLPNLKHLHVPDLIRIAQERHEDFFRELATDLDGPDADEIRVYTRQFQQQEATLAGLLGRAESIMHPKLTPEDLVNSFVKLRIDGANLKHLAFTSRSARAQRSDLAKVLRHFPNLESLNIHLKMFNDRGGINRIVVDDPTFKPSRISLPHLRKLTLMGFYDGQEVPKTRPSSSPLLRLARSFAGTLRTLVLDVRLGDFDQHWDEELGIDEDEEDDASAFAALDAAEGSQLAFTSSFPLLRQLTLQGLPSAFEHLLPSIDSEKLPALESCLCDFSPTAKDNSSDDDDDALLDLADALSRIPGFELAHVPAELESIKHNLVKYVRPRAQNDWYGPHIDSTWPGPLHYPPLDVAATHLREQVQPTMDHLNEWYRHACDSNDVYGLAQIRDGLEKLSARRLVLEAWAGAGGPKSDVRNL